MVSIQMVRYQKKRVLPTRSAGRSPAGLSRPLAHGGARGGDPGMNPSLGLAVQKAKAANMPNDNIWRAVDGDGRRRRRRDLSHQGYAPGESRCSSTSTADNHNGTASVSTLHCSPERRGKLGTGRSGFLSLRGGGRDPGPHRRRGRGCSYGGRARAGADVETRGDVVTSPEDFATVRERHCATRASSSRTPRLRAAPEQHDLDVSLRNRLSGL